jgi:hypothetical protein
MGFDDTNDTRADVQAKEPEHEPLSLVGVFDKPTPPNFIQEIKGLDGKEKPRDQTVPAFRLPVGHPTVGPGTRFSDIIRDKHEDDVKFHLGPRIRRGDVTTPPTLPERKDVPTTVSPAVPMESVNASPEFQQRIREQVDAFPAGVRKLLSDKGMAVRVSDNIVDAAPDLKDERPRGWPPGSTFANEDGAFRPDQRLILVSETFKDSSGKDVRSDRSAGVLRHETGHAVDAALDNYSQEADFKAAYDKDVAAMSPEAKAKLAYLLQADGAGAQECFAEIFAAIYGGSANDSQTALILQSFPEATDLVRKKMNSLP